MQPQTGTRATGTVLVTAIEGTPGNVELPRSAYALAVVDGKLRQDLVFKVDEGPGTKVGSEDNNVKGWWPVDAVGVSINFVSNLGGDRHNLPPGTELQFDPPITGIQPRCVVENPGFTNGVSPSFFGALNNVIMYEQFDGPQKTVDIFRSSIGKPPIALIVWTNSEPADGTVISTTARETRVGTRKVLYKEQYAIYVIVNRKDNEHTRRLEGLTILDTISELLTDRQSVDGICFSNPSGIQIRERFRDFAQGQEMYQEFYIYGLRLSAERLLRQTDVRTYNDWLRTAMMLTTPDNEVANQGPFTVVDTSFDMLHDAYDDGYSDGYA
jgi:hypothetical protein